MKNLTLIHSNEHNGFISCDTFGTNSISFNIDLPRNACVDHIRINGEFETDDYGTQTNRMLEDVPCASVVYHREFAFEACNPDRMQRVAGTLYNVPSDLYTKVMVGKIDSFDVYYHFESVTEA